MDITSDEVMILHSQYSTQWDSLAHVGQLFDADGDGVAEPVYYNGYRAYEHVGGTLSRVSELGARALGIENMAETGVQGRAVLVDLHAHFRQSSAWLVDYDALAGGIRKGRRGGGRGRYVPHAHGLGRS